MTEICRFQVNIRLFPKLQHASVAVELQFDAGPACITTATNAMINNTSTDGMTAATAAVSEVRQLCFIV